VIDNGTGIPLDLINKVFEPFFTTKPQGEGTGLGLSMTYGFARQSGGSARIASEPGEGTEVELLLPEGQQPAAEPQADPIQIQRGHAERILLVDDTDSVRMMVREMLLEVGYQVVEATNAQQALLELHSARAVDLLLSDVGLPGMNGRDLADAARALRPSLPVLFITGYTESAAVRNEFLGEGMSLLPKPFSVHELLHSVGAMFGPRQ
jgi:CheY-like chemotaxis protein